MRVDPLSDDEPEGEPEGPGGKVGRTSGGGSPCKGPEKSQRVLGHEEALRPQ